MLGYAEMKEAVVWIQTVKPANVYAIYKNVLSIDGLLLSTDTLKTSANKAFSGHLYFNQVEPGQTYEYVIYINNNALKRPYPLQFTTQPDWAHKTDPLEFSMALGSCVYINEKAYDRPGKPYGNDYQIFNSIASKNSNAMLWLGDNTYLRPADYSSKTGYLHRYTHTRSIPELQALLASCNHFAIWDDHEFGPNDASGSWAKKDIALEVFKAFWANPSYGYADLPGITSSFQYMDMDFILMDNRYHRTENFNKGEKHIFGKTQTEHLINLLKSSHSPFKFIVTGGQFLNTAPVFENHSNFGDERAYILKRINEENITGVIFLTGDRHHSEVMKHTLPNGNPVYEFTVSPLTARASKDVDESNDHLIEGSIIKERNFAIMKFTGTIGKRKLDLDYYNSDGKFIYHYSIDQ